MMASPNAECLQEKREKEFLEACGFDLSNGFWSEDVEYWKQLEPGLWKQIVVYS